MRSKKIESLKMILWITKIAICVLFFVGMLSCKNIPSWKCRQLPDSTVFLINIADVNNSKLDSLLLALSEKPVKVLGLNYSQGDIDSLFFLSSLERYKNIVITTQSDKSSANNYDLSLLGSITLTRDQLFINEEGVVDSYNACQNLSNDHPTSFSCEMLKKITQSSQTWGKKKRLLIDFIGDINCFTNFDAEFALKMKDEINWQDKIVILGYLGSSDYMVRTEFDSTDSYYTPLSKDHRVYSTVIHANILTTLIRRKSN